MRVEVGAEEKWEVRMINEEVGIILSFPVCLLTSVAVLPCSFDDRDEDGDEFVALGAERLELGGWHDFSIDEEFQPILRFLQFSQ